MNFLARMKEAFVTVRLHRSNTDLFDAIVNPEYINYILPSGPGQMGESILTLHGKERSVLPALEGIDVLAGMLPNLTKAQLYNSSGGQPGLTALINLARVVQVRDLSTCLELSFLDGSELRVVNTSS